MPTFIDGQDPLDATQGRSVRAPTGPQPTDPFSGPTPEETIGAAFRQNNPIVSVVHAINQSRPDQTPIPGYDPITPLIGTKYEGLIGQSLGDVNPAQTRARMAEQDQEEKDQQALAGSGWAGTVASLGAGALDPSWLIPIGGELSAAGKGLSLGARLARGAAEGALRSGVSETALMGSQVTRTPQEAVADVASNTLLMGLLGGAHGFLSASERKAAADGLDGIRKDFAPPEPHTEIVPPDIQGPRAEALAEKGTAETTAAINGKDRTVSWAIDPDSGEPKPTHVDGQPVFEGGPKGEMAFSPEPQPTGSSFASSLSAAGSEQRTMELSPILPEQVRNSVGAIPGGEKALDWMRQIGFAASPSGRTFLNGSLPGKLAMGDLAETSLKFTQAAKGVIASTVGTVPIDALVRLDKRRYIMKTRSAVEKAYVKYLGVQGQQFARQKAVYRGMMGVPDKLNLADFKRQVYLANTMSDQHQIPEVAEAAREIRQNVYEPVMKLAQSIKGPDGKPMLGEELSAPAGDQSFAPRIWNREAVNANPRAFVKKVEAWLTQQQQEHEAIKARLAPIQERHEKLVDALAKLDGRIATNKQRIVKTGAALKERGMETNRATDRVETLEERNQKIDAGVSELEEFLAETKSAVEAPDADPFDREQYDNLQRDVANLKASKASNTIRVNEAGVPVSASESRFMDLADRQSRYQVMQDLLDRARGNAEQERVRLRGKMEDEVGKWKGKTSEEAIAALKGRAEAERVRGLKQEAGVYEGKGDRLASADSAVDRAVKAMLAREERSPQEIHSLANEIKHRIDVSPDGRLPYDAPTGGPEMGSPGVKNDTRGSLNGRDFAIPTKDALDFIHTDPEHTIPAYLRTILPDLRLTERFGDVNMTEQFKKINEDYDQKIDQAKSDKVVAKLQAQRAAEIRDIAATRDRIRGTYGLPSTTVQRNMGRVARAVGNWNVGAFLGTSVINRFQDMANATARRGFMGYMQDGFVPYFQGLLKANAGSAAQRQAMKDLGVGVDTTMGHIASQFWDVAEDHLPGNRVERGLRSGASLAMVVTGHGPWTDMNKQIAGMAASADLLRTAGRIAKGTASERDIRIMAHAGIDPNMAARISAAFEDGHTVVGDSKIPNSGEWKDRTAATAFEAAIQKDADIAVITPGAEKPLFLSDPVMGLLGQFKGFTMAAQERILISNLQEADGRTLQGFFHMLAMGMLSYRLYTLAAGQPVSDRPQDWLKEAVTRSGALGWMSDANQIQAKFFGGKTDAWNLIGANRPVSRTAALSAPEQLLGPAYSLFSGLAHAATNASFHAWSAQDTHRIRQAMFLQNLAFFRRLLDKAEDGFNEYIGVKPMNRDRTTWPGAPQQ
jgi:hypothetical protein